MQLTEYTMQHHIQDRCPNMTQLSNKLGGRSRTSIYRDLEAKRLPPPVRIGGRLYWRESEIDDAGSALSEAQVFAGGEAA